MKKTKKEKRVEFFLVFVNGTNSREDTLSYLPIRFSCGSLMGVIVIAYLLTSIGVIEMRTVLYVGYVYINYRSR